MDYRTAFDYTVQRILDKCCVPVAGAGISNTSSSPLEEKVHTVSWIVSELQKEILKIRFKRFKRDESVEVCQKCKSRLSEHKINIEVGAFSKYSCFFCDIRVAADRLKLGELSELFIWEQTSDKNAQLELVKLLKIASYADLEPTSAHEYIAKIAKEGLIDEVITTNYDCNFEKAFGECAGVEAADVITCLNDYRLYGAKQDGSSRLKIYKVNGCSKKLNECLSEETCESILLTERQLQRWRNRKWASDIFRDRLRSKSLFFVGFGSDEPQIHHTLQTVVDEYEDNVCIDSSDIFRTPSAPIVAIFEPYPTFHQQQIVNTYALRHGFRAIDGDLLIIRANETNGCLPADRLWEAIYERVIRVLILRALRQSVLAVNASFTSVVPYAHRFLGQVISSVEEAAKRDQELCTGAPVWISRLFEKTSKGNSYGHHFEAIANCLQALRKRPKIYEPVSENNALVSELLFLFYLLRNRIVSGTVNYSGGLISVSVDCGDSTTHAVRKLCVVTDYSFFSGKEGNIDVSNTVQLILILGNSGVRTKSRVSRRLNVDKNNNTIAPRKNIYLGWEDIYSSKKMRCNMDSIVEILVDALKFPSTFFDPRISMRRRSFLSRDQKNE